MATQDSQDKEISIGLTFKKVTLDLQPQQFSALVDETATALKQRVLAVFDAQRAAKGGAAIGGLDPLESKGVELILRVTF